MGSMAEGRPPNMLAKNLMMAKINELGKKDANSLIRQLEGMDELAEDNSDITKVT